MSAFAGWFKALYDRDLMPHQRTLLESMNNLDAAERYRWINVPRDPGKIREFYGRAIMPQIDGLSNPFRNYYTQSNVEIAKCWDADGNEVEMPPDHAALYHAALERSMSQAMEFIIDDPLNHPWEPTARPTMTALGTIFGACLT